MQVTSITASFAPPQKATQTLVAVARDHDDAVRRINDKLARATGNYLGNSQHWIFLNLPFGDASVIRSTPLGAVQFCMEQHEL